jgi:hypothetical protein
MGRRPVAMIGLALALLTGGCAVSGGTAGPERAPGPPEVHERWESCATARPAAASAPPGVDDGREALRLPRLDDGFAAVSAVLCRGAIHRRPGGGEDMVAAEERADDVTALVAALRLPDEKPTADICTMELVILPFIALLDAQGRWVRPGVPVSACRQPRREVRDAVDRLTLRPVSSRPLGQITSDRAAAAGCTQRWADMVWVTGESGSAESASPAALPPGDADVRICVYAVPAGQRGGGKPAGDFVAGGKLPAGRWAEVRHALTTAAPAAPCTTPSSRFAVLHLPAGQVYVEADGCRRALIDTGTTPPALRQAGTALTNLVFRS